MANGVTLKYVTEDGRAWDSYEAARDHVDEARTAVILKDVARIIADFIEVPHRAAVQILDKYDVTPKLVAEIAPAPAPEPPIIDEAPRMVPRSDDERMPF